VWGHHTGHCGRDQSGDFRKCSPENVMCGSLHCKDGRGSPIMQNKYTSTTFSKTTITINRVEHECKNLNSPKGDASADLELVRNGTRCGEGKVKSYNIQQIYNKLSQHEIGECNRKFPNVLMNDDMMI